LNFRNFTQQLEKLAVDEKVVSPKIEQLKKQKQKQKQTNNNRSKSRNDARTQ
jgi:hypothetical protein